MLPPGSRPPDSYARTSLMSGPSPATNSLCVGTMSGSPPRPHRPPCSPWWSEQAAICPAAVDRQEVTSRRLGAPADMYPRSEFVNQLVELQSRLMLSQGTAYRERRPEARHHEVGGLAKHMCAAVGAAQRTVEGQAAVAAAHSYRQATE